VRDERRLSEHVVLLRRGESVAWLEIMGAKVHVTIVDGSPRAALAHLIDKLKR